MTERKHQQKRRLNSSRSAEDLLFASQRLRDNKRSITIGLKPTSSGSSSVKPSEEDDEYSEVWQPELSKESTCIRPEVSDTCQAESVGQDSGISSTSDSTISYSNKRSLVDLEDLTKVPWYEGVMPR